MTPGALLKIELGPFARSGIEALSGSDFASGVHEALLHYTGRLGSRDPIAPPRFFHERPSCPGDEAVFTLAVDPDTKAALRHEADRHGVSLQRIVRHAVMVYLAETDAAAAAKDPRGTPVPL